MTRFTVEDYMKQWARKNKDKRWIGDIASWKSWNELATKYDSETARERCESIEKKYPNVNWEEIKNESR